MKSEVKISSTKADEVEVGDEIYVFLQQNYKILDSEIAFDWSYYHSNVRDTLNYKPLSSCGLYNYNLPSRINYKPHAFNYNLVGCTLNYKPFNVRRSLHMHSTWIRALLYSASFYYYYYYYYYFGEKKGA